MKNFLRDYAPYVIFAATGLIAAGGLYAARIQMDRALANKVDQAVFDIDRQHLAERMTRLEKQLDRIENKIDELR